MATGSDWPCHLELLGASSEGREVSKREDGLGEGSVCGPAIEKKVGVRRELRSRGVELEVLWMAEATALTYFLPAL